MLYSNGGYRHQMGIYWYDADGDCHEMDVWDEFEEMVKRPTTWYIASFLSAGFNNLLPRIESSRCGGEFIKKVSKYIFEFLCCP